MSADVQNPFHAVKFAILRMSTQRKEKTMREFWITVASMVLGYLMYLGIRSMGKK